MDLNEYASARRKKPGVDAMERWNTRIVPRGLHQQGYQGAQQYMSDYGRAMGAPKAIALACQCEEMGANDMARGFWEVAAKLEKVTISDIGKTAQDNIFVSQAVEVKARSDDFPPNLQPGRVAPMQPSDAAGNREYYITSSNYWGQRKRDGHKLIVFATPMEVWYQSRSTKLRVEPGALFDSALMQCAMDRGAFILEGELYYLDAMGGEHKTGAQAATANIEMGKSGVAPKMRYMPFVCLFDGQDLRDDTYAVRVLRATTIARDLDYLLPGTFDVCKTYRTEDEKRLLVQMQQAEGREGEIWFSPTMPYTSGKQRTDRIVRTKYLMTEEYIVTRLTPTTAAGRLFGAIEVSDLQGIPVGSVGTGFSQSAQAKIVKMFDGLYSEGKPMRVIVTHQGFTEGHQLVHARLDDERF